VWMPVLLALVAMSGNVWWLILVPVAGWMLWRLLPSGPPVAALGCDNGQWWLERSGRRHWISWRRGSVRRADLLVLYWSPWPWQAIVLRRGHFGSDEEFRQLRVALYSMSDQSQG
jgi:hypothetical protein